MKRASDPTPADHRRFDRLLWGPGGIYEDYCRNRWQGSIATFGIPPLHHFSAFGHQWMLDFAASLWSRSLEVSISLSPHRLLPERETDRLRQAGIYDDFVALFQRWGYRLQTVSPRGGMWCRRRISRPSDIPRSWKPLESLDLNAYPGISAARGTRDRGRNFAELLGWMRRSRSKGWRAECVEFSVPAREYGGGIRWTVRRDLLVGPTKSCTWFYAWPPKAFMRADWRRVERAGFFQRSTEDLVKLGYEGYWRPGLFSDPDRLAAEFWKPTLDPRTARKDFDALLHRRVP